MPLLISGQASTGLNPYDPRNIDTLHRFLSIYEEQAERLDDTLLDGQDELGRVRARIASLQHELQDLEVKQDEHMAR
ncbi:unnamed protein product [Protopolystoma xenopodis]|uniref:Uncharacterized protein n=1 Tax=Protopolystoma xenopodis TaxID=117903 RepID=A0A3S5B763_9PLAT|nr:unnamed protein product [Protopolystoma xenopodis]